MRVHVYTVHRSVSIYETAFQRSTFCPLFCFLPQWMYTVYVSQRGSNKNCEQSDKSANGAYLPCDMAVTPASFHCKCQQTKVKIEERKHASITCDQLYIGKKNWVLHLPNSSLLSSWIYRPCHSLPPALLRLSPASFLPSGKPHRNPGKTPLFEALTNARSIYLRLLCVVPECYVLLLNFW